ncbi:hypothetical protein ACFMPD_11620 [Sedimentitalea sp. HM32M-2]|uniref:hypothetical protein n=1 Tax=Sedimentitalea sp. HM32M-2 TaxID=3351566 RepID=UPI0036276A38
MIIDLAPSLRCHPLKGFPMSRLFSIFFLVFAPLQAMAEWQFNGGDSPNAFTQTANMTLELQCDRMRFAPAGYEASQDMTNKQGLSIRFMKDGKTEVGSFQAGAQNSSIQIVDDYPVEIEFFDPADYQFVLEQMAANSTLDLSMVDKNITYGVFDLTGSAAAIRSLTSACQSTASVSPEAPEGVVYCGGGAVKRQIEYVIIENSNSDWNATVTVNGESIKAMTAYSYFGDAEPPRGFIVALLGEDRSEFLVFEDQDQRWIEYGDYRYDQCN